MQWANAHGFSLQRVQGRAALFSGLATACSMGTWQHSYLLWQPGTCSGVYLFLLVASFNCACTDKRCKNCVKSVGVVTGVGACTCAACRITGELSEHSLVAQASVVAAESIVREREIETRRVAHCSAQLAGVIGVHIGVIGVLLPDGCSGPGVPAHQRSAAPEQLAVWSACLLAVLHIGHCQYYSATQLNLLLATPIALSQESTKGLPSVWGCHLAVALSACLVFGACRFGKRLPDYQHHDVADGSVTASLATVG